MSDVWPVLHYDDTVAARHFLVDVLGFAETVVVLDDDGDVVHAELRWSGGGTVLFGGTKHTDSIHGGTGSGAAATYLVTDDVDAVVGRVRESGRGRVLVDPAATTFGNGAEAYAATVADPEANLWTFGTYRGA